MEPKKNPKADVGRNSALYFVIGLAAVLALVYGAMEWKKYDKVNNYDISMNVEDQLDEEVPMTEQIKTPPPPPPPAAPEVIEVVEDEEIGTCTCMEHHKLHFHQDSPVDLQVKLTMGKGFFRLMGRW